MYPTTPSPQTPEAYLRGRTHVASRVALRNRLQRRIASVKGDIRGTEIIAHRGFAGALPQNTLFAFAAALQRGAHSIEFDVQTSSDGELVVFHDLEVDDLTDGTGAVVDLDLETLQGLAFDEVAGGPFAELYIPTFAEVLEWAAERGVRVYPEIKAYRSSADLPDFAQAVVDAGMEERCTMQSFNYDTDFPAIRGVSRIIELCATMEPDRTEQQFKDAVDYVGALGVACVAPHFSDMVENPDWVEYAYSRDVDVVVYGVNFGHDVDDVARVGVKRIMQDLPQRLGFGGV